MSTNNFSRDCLIFSALVLAAMLENWIGYAIIVDLCAGALLHAGLSFYLARHPNTDKSGWTPPRPMPPSPRPGAPQ